MEQSSSGGRVLTPADEGTKSAQGCCLTPLSISTYCVKGLLVLDENGSEAEAAR